MQGYITPSIESGKLRFLVTIQSLVGTKDSFGQEVQSWQTFKQVWASIEPLMGRELIAAQQIAGQADVKIRSRYVAGVTPKMRATYGGHTYDIQGVQNVANRNRELVMMCVERVEEAGYTETGA
jgi:SPP1 family predicted phage head-tail adaptor